MTTALNATHAPQLRSWVESANAPENGFPIQNLPFGVFHPENEAADWRVGVAIGDSILDIRKVAALAPFQGQAAEALAACKGQTLNALMGLPATHTSALRAALSAALAQGSALQPVLASALSPRLSAHLKLPAQIGDYTDFYISLHHATAVGRQFRPDNPLLPNYKWVPIGYHGRASSIIVSGQSFTRPIGQTRPAQEGAAPAFGPAQRLDYELELGLFIGQGNDLGQRIDIETAESHLFGLCLLNDWSARDFQAWEYQPLGPFLAKNFASTLSPWVVTLEALAPFRIAFNRDAQDPQPLPYLSSEANTRAGAFDIDLQVLLTTAQSRQTGQAPHQLARSNFRHAYWTPAQLLAHHTVNGCNLRPGDLLGTGTLSGPEAGEEGSLLELTQGGKQAVQLPWGEQRSFLLDGDEIILKAECRKEGYPLVSLGECSGIVLAAT
ncbi:fumarylacetoacetase [Pusillimonas sp. CC-YST705]|uniref:fumarylacetoacetase n=1 Tax=Mesopusillimonas faecipullorum TaxID=2755040 RepID=A0ABS8CCB1_9BURK|nr:fumarylacetoacetase [Mesopusillimonas faecipullorum]MCB5363484.1 fumarylacetoacetase [Mesopusillimonas faecipullorum]